MGNKILGKTCVDWIPKEVFTICIFFWIVERASGLLGELHLVAFCSHLVFGHMKPGFNYNLVKSGQMKAGFNYDLVVKQNSWKYETRTRFNSGHMHNLPASEDWLSINAKDRMTISNSLPQDPPGVTNNFPRTQTFLSLIRVQWSGPITQLGGCASVPVCQIKSLTALHPETISSYASLKTLSQTNIWKGCGCVLQRKSWISTPNMKRGETKMLGR